jgi:hypothetical protein
MDVPSDGCGDTCGAFRILVSLHVSCSGCGAFSCSMGGSVVGVGESVEGMVDGKEY